MDTQKPNTKDNKKPAKNEQTTEKQMPKEFGGFENQPEPTRYGDWEVKGRCSDF